MNRLFLRSGADCGSPTEAALLLLPISPMEPTDDAADDRQELID